MKYLKEYNDEKISYQEINQNDSDELIRNNKPLLSFNSNEFTLIFNMFQDVKYNSNVTKRTIIANKRIYVYKLQDEWYIVKYLRDSFTNYKCDQIHGLISCLEMLKNHFHMI